MRTKTVLIERAPDGGYSAYVKEEMPYGVIGQGNTVQEVIEDFKDCVEDMRETYAESGEDFEEFDFTFEHDTRSVLEYFKDVFSMPAIQKMTGINDKQLFHYYSGISVPKKETTLKIEKAFHELGRELLAVKLH